MAVETLIKDGIAELVFNKPPVNAFNSDEWAEIADVITQLGVNKKVNVIVIRAEGKGFCAGVDIKELAADTVKLWRLTRVTMILLSLFTETQNLSL